MPKTRTTPATLPKTQDERKRVYAEPELMDALDAIAELNRKDERGPQSRSKILCGLGMAYIGKNKERLKAAGYVMPASLVAKLNGK